MLYKIQGGSKNVTSGNWIIIYGLISIQDTTFLVNWCFLKDLETEEWWKITAKAVYGRAESQNLSIRSRLPLKVVFHRGLSSVKGSLPSKVVFHQRLSSIKGRLPSKFFYHQRVSSIKGQVWHSLAQSCIICRVFCCSRYVVFIELIHLNDLIV